jgi:hypothetical protein
MDGWAARSARRVAELLPTVLSAFRPPNLACYSFESLVRP